MSPKHPSDTIDQLVCGTLRGSAYREALLWLDADAKRWRACALAFLQEQAIEQDLRQVAAESLDWHSDRMPPIGDLGTEDLGTIGDLGTDDLGTIGDFAPSSASRSNSGHPKKAMKLAGLAAMLLLSFGVGWMGSLPGSRGIQNSQNSSNQTDGLLAEAIEKQEPRPSGSDRRTNGSSGWRGQLAGDHRSVSDSVSKGHLRHVRYGDQDSQSSWALSGSAFRNNPALAGNLSRRLLPIDQEIPRELLELERMGRIRIETSSALLPIENEDGSSFLVPVQQLQIVPVVFSY